MGANENRGKNQYQAVQRYHSCQRCSSLCRQPSSQRQEYGRVADRIDNRKQRPDHQKDVLYEITEGVVHQLSLYRSAREEDGGDGLRQALNGGQSAEPRGSQPSDRIAGSTGSPAPA